MILAETDLDQYISKEVPKLDGHEGKAIHKKKLVMSKRLIVEYIKDILTPHVSSLKTPTEVFDALTKLFKGNKIN